MPSDTGIGPDEGLDGDTTDILPPDELPEEEEDIDIPVGPMVIRDQGGWAYRVLEDGSIKVIDAPSGSRALGKVLAPGSKYHTAIKTDSSIRSKMSEEARDALGVAGAGMPEHTVAEDDAPEIGKGVSNSWQSAADKVGARLDQMHGPALPKMGG